MAKDSIFDITISDYKMLAYLELAKFTYMNKPVFELDDVYYISIIDEKQFKLLYKDNSNISCFYTSNYTVNDKDYYVIDVSDYSGIHQDGLFKALI